VTFGLLFYGALSGLALVWRWGWVGASIVYRSSTEAAAGVAWLRDGLAGLSVAALLIFLSYVWTRGSRSGERLARVLASALGPLGVVHTTLLACMSGLAEELLFRGALQPEIGLIAASVVFGLAHCVPGRGLFGWSVFAILAGLLLGALYIVTGNLFASIVAHTVVNAVNLPFIIRRYGTGQNG